MNSSKTPELQISRIVCLLMHFSELQRKIPENSKTAKFCSDLKNRTTHRRRIDCKQRIPFTGKGKLMDPVLESYKTIFGNKLQENHKIFEFSGLFQNHKFYQIEEKGQRKVSDSSCIKFRYNGQESYGIIVNFVKLCSCPTILCDGNCEGFAIIKEWIVEPAFWCDFAEMFVPKCFECINIVDNLIFISTEDILTVGYKVPIDTSLFLSEPLNNVEFE